MKTYQTVIVSMVLSMALLLSLMSLTNSRDIGASRAVMMQDEAIADLRFGVTCQTIPQYIFDELQNESVLIESGGCRGTGVLVTRQLGDETHTYVWTAGHVAKEAMKPDGTFDNVTVVQEKRVKGLVVKTTRTGARIISYSDPATGDDLALLEILKPNFTAASARFGDTKTLEIGTPLIHVGCTFGLYNSTSLGIMSQTDRNIFGKTFDQTSCIGYPGSSGGGIYTYDGKCIGILVRGAGAGLNFIVPMRRLHTWATKMGVLWAIDPNVPMPVAVVRLPTPLTDATPLPKDIVLPMAPGGPK
jgi:hypothetical protein